MIIVKRIFFNWYLKNIAENKLIELSFNLQFLILVGLH